MTTWTATLADTFFNELLNVPKEVSKRVTKKIKILEQDPISAQGDAKKLQNYKNTYRVRIGNYRIIYSIGQGWFKLLSIRKRDEDTYKVKISDNNELPNSIPDSSLLEPQEIEAEITEVQEEEFSKDDQFPSITTDLPFQFTESLLKQWQIPEQYWSDILKVQNAEALLELSIPDKFISRILDICFPRSLEEIERSPEYLLNNPEDIDRFVEGNLSGFLLKLTPEQEKLLDFGKLDHAVLVKGGAGTGKSTLALYRVKKLLELGYTSILFTTYTNALVNYSKQLLEQLLGKPPAELGVEVTTVDSLTYKYYVAAHGKPRFAREEKCLNLLDIALATTKIPARNVFDAKVRQQKLARLGLPYLLEEIQYLIEAWGISTLEEYLSIERRGRNFPLNANLRETFWAVYQTWRALMRKNGYLIWERLRVEAKKVVTDLPEKPYQALIIDEAQDLSPVALRFLLALVQSFNGVYLTADASQSIYQRGFSWKQINSDLKFQGNTLTLRQNYRNTQQIVVACTQILANTNAGDSESIHQQPSVHSGAIPTVLLTDKLEKQAEAIHQGFVTTAKQFRLPLHSGAVLCPNHKIGREITQKLSQRGLKAKFFSSKNIDIKSSYIKVLTLRSAKGLEFPFVAIVGLEEGCLPSINTDFPPDEIQSVLDRERRLFYVGCSRAMRFLMVCGSYHNPSSFLNSVTHPNWQIIKNK